MAAYNWEFDFDSSFPVHLFRYNVPGHSDRLHWQNASGKLRAEIYRVSESRIMVNGPSLVSATSICAPKTPVPTS